MVKIRLARSGAKKRPFYHVVATDSRSGRDGRFLERLGYYNPKASGGETRLEIDRARVDHWTQNGAQVSERVTYLLSQVKDAAPKAKPETAGADAA